MAGSIGAMMKKRHATQLGIHSAGDLAHQSVMKYGVVGASAIWDFFRGSRVPDYARMWQEISADPSSGVVQTVEEGIQRVLESSDEHPWAFLSGSEVLRARQTCDTTVLNFDLSLGSALAGPIGSPYRDRFNLAILELIEAGDLAVIRTKWFTPADCDHSANGAVKRTALITCVEQCALLLAFVYALMR